MKIIEKKIVIIIALLITLILSYMKIISENGMGDTTFLQQLTENIAFKGKTISDTADAAVDLVNSGLLTNKADTFKTVPLGKRSHEERNIFKIHSYIILFLIAPFCWLISSKILLTTLVTISFVTMIFLLYIFLREKKISIAVSILFCLLIISHPAWSLSYAGQLYVERLFIGSCSLYIYLLLKDKKNIILIFIIALLSSIISERTGIMIGLFTLGYAVLYWKKILKKDKVSLLIIGIVCSAISILIVIFYIDNNNFGFLPTSLNALIQRFEIAYFADGFISFVILNIIIMGIFSIFEWRLFILALIIMIPNMIGNIGGAEKINYFTHYHSLYFPCIIWSASVGFSRLLNKSNQKYIKLIYLLIVAVIILISGIYPYNLKSMNFTLRNFHNNALIKYFRLLPLHFNDKYFTKQETIYNAIRTSVQEKSIVTTTEYMMPVLYKNRNIYLYPMGLDIADYAVIGINYSSSGNPEYSGAISFLGIEEQNKINKVLIDRMKNSGYDFKNIQVIQNIAIIRRYNKSTK